MNESVLVVSVLLCNWMDNLHVFFQFRHDYAKITKSVFLRILALVNGFSIVTIGKNSLITNLFKNKSGSQNEKNDIQSFFLGNVVFNLLFWFLRVFKVLKISFTSCTSLKRNIF
jgi:hypothetical protein